MKTKKHSFTKFSFLFFFLLTVFAFQSCQRQKPVEAQKGVLDLQKWNFQEQGNIPLSGEWQFYWRRFIPAQNFLRKNFELPQSGWIQVPSSSWTKAKGIGEKIFAHGYATYHLKVLLPQDLKKEKRIFSLKLRDVATAYRLYINGELISKSGKIAAIKKFSKPCYKHVVRNFEVLPKDKNTLDITVHVSNFHYSKAGIWDQSFIFGTPQNIYRAKTITLGYDLFLFGSLLIISIYYFVIFFWMRKEKGYFLFGLFTFVFSLRILVRGEMLLLFFFPHFPFSLDIKIEYLSFYVSPIIFYWFLYFTFHNSLFSKRAGQIITGVSALFSAIVLLFSPNIFTRTINYYQLFTLVVIILVLYGFLKGLLKKETGILVAMLGSIFFSFTTINDILFLNNFSTIGEISPLGVFIFIFSQAFMLSLRFSKSFETKEYLTKYLESLYRSNARFVPKAAVNFLEKNTVIDIQLGDNIEREMSILFCDIRNFTSLSESMLPQDIFNFLNNYLQEVSPQIRNNQGFVDKYLGDGIMSLFPDSPDAALSAAIEIQKKIKEHNVKRLLKNRIPLAAGIGLHKGNLLLGTIGEKERFNIAVISENVDIAYRLEGLTKKLGTPVLISEDIKTTLKESYALRRVGAIQTPKDLLSIYEVLDVYEEDKKQLRLQTLQDFEKALGFLAAKNYESAKKLFQKILQKDKEDKAALYHLNRIFLEDENSAPDFEFVSEPLST